MTAPVRHRARARRPYRDTQMRVIDPVRIRRARLAKEWTQEFLGDRCNRSQNAIHLLETGQSDTITEEFAMSLTRELGLVLDKVFVDIPASLLDSVANCGEPVDQESA